MKSFLFAALASASLLTSTSAFATPLDNHDRDDRRYEQLRPGDRDFNYGFDRNHRVTRDEITRYEAQHRNDRRDDHFDRNQNYGFERDHRVTREERRRWEAGHNYGYAQGYRVSPQERARWEDSYRR
jgi:hypothetical protein